ncbi:unnamed protein product [Protopolystoma xenopodis]|uniref:Transmembrane protein n=1 Tax=Protopolystoma xenopodis TaxID=117903 RepID=A0A3S5ADL3_9PLAT|nr:unnamed protein product [Protopolystoma xenopodis]
MQNSSKLDGGIFQFVPFQSVDWIREFAISSLRQTDIILHLLPAPLGIVIFTLLLHRIFHLTRRKSHDNRAISPVVEPEIAAPNVAQDDWILPTAEQDSNALAVLDRHRTTGFNASRETRQAVALSISRSINNPTKFFLGLTYFFSLLLFLVISFFTILAVSDLSSDLQALPNHTVDLLASGLRFANDSLHSAYQITLNQVSKDARLPKPLGSRLIHLVNSAKLNFARLVVDLAASKNLHGAARSPVRLTDNGTTMVAARRLVNLFDLLVMRVDGLMQALEPLNSTSESRIQGSWYTYRDACKSMLYARPYRSLLTPGFTEGVKDSPTQRGLPPLLRETENLLCDSAKQANCSAVHAYLARVSQYLHENISSLLPNGSFKTVTKYALVLQMVDAEKQAHAWIPALASPVAKGAPVLLHHFLLPEMDRLVETMNHWTRTLYPPSLQARLADYLHFTIKVAIAIVSCLLCLGLLLTCLSCVIWCQRARKFGEPEKELSNHWPSKCAFRLVVLCLFGAICFLIIWPTWLIGLVGSLGNTQFCRYLTLTPNRRLADALLEEGIRRDLFLTHLPVAFQQILELQLHSPYPLITTLATEYRPGQKEGLLASLGMNRPFNFTAVLDSAWLNITLHEAWRHVVRPLLEGSDLTSKLPKTDVSQIFLQTRKSLKLDNLYDSLKVEPVTRYLVDPGLSNIFEPIVAWLQLIDSKEATYLLPFFVNASRLYVDYSEGFKQTRVALELVQKNKMVLGPLQQLIDVVSPAYKTFSSADNKAAVDFVERTLFQSWPEQKDLAKSTLVPFVYDLLDEMVPYGGIKQIFQLTVGTMCSPNYSSPSKSRQREAMFENIRKYGLYTMLTAITVLMLTVFLSFLL